MSCLYPGVAASPPPPAEGRDARQRDLVPPEALARAHAVVIGVGAGGRLAAMFLASMGVPRLTLIDFDTIEEVNLGPQGWFADEVGTSKVAAIANLCRRLNPAVSVLGVPRRFRAGDALAYDEDTAVFCCVDKIEARAHIWDAVKRTRCGLWVDGRMSGETVLVYAVDGPDGHDYYDRSFFPAGEAYPESCTAKTTIYAAGASAAVMVAEFAHHLRGLRVKRKVTTLLREMDMFAERHDDLIPEADDEPESVFARPMIEVPAVV